MNFTKEQYKSSLTWARLFTAKIIIASALMIYLPIEHYEVFGLNSLLKSVKFVLGIAIMCYTLEWLLYYFDCSNPDGGINLIAKKN